MLREQFSASSASLGYVAVLGGRGITKISLSVAKISLDSVSSRNALTMC